MLSRALLAGITSCKLFCCGVHDSSGSSLPLCKDDEDILSSIDARPFLLYTVILLPSSWKGFSSARLSESFLSVDINRKKKSEISVCWYKKNLRFLAVYIRKDEDFICWCKKKKLGFLSVNVRKIWCF